MPPVGHCDISPSKSESWVPCPPSIAAGKDIEEATSEYAAAGTAAHELGEWKGKKILKQKAGRRPFSDYHDDDMQTFTDDYALFIKDKVDYLKKEYGEPFVAFEQHVELTDPPLYGTCDFLAIAGGVLQIIDLKYGYLEVSAVENSQLMIYALCALNEFDCLYDIEEVHLAIFQPRIQNVSEWSISAKDLYEWGETVLKPAAEEAMKGEGEFNPGPWCTHNFCKCRFVCRARAEYLMEIAKFEFTKPALLSDEEILEVMAKADELSKWCDDVMAYAQAQAIAGKKWPGYKIVEGRSVRKFSDEKAVEEAAINAGYTDIYQPKSLITLTAFEKLLGKDKFNEVLGSFVTKSQGKLTLVPESDKRPEANIATVNEDFS